MGGLWACLAIRMPSAGGETGLGTRRAGDPERGRRAAGPAALQGQVSGRGRHTVNGDYAFALPTNAGGISRQVLNPTVEKTGVRVPGAGLGVAVSLASGARTGRCGPHPISGPRQCRVG